MFLLGLYLILLKFNAFSLSFVVFDCKNAWSLGWLPALFVIFAYETITWLDGV